MLFPNVSIFYDIVSIMSNLEKLVLAFLCIVFVFPSCTTSKTVPIVKDSDSKLSISASEQKENKQTLVQNSASETLDTSNEVAPTVIPDNADSVKSIEVPTIILKSGIQSTNGQTNNDTSYTSAVDDKGSQTTANTNASNSTEFIDVSMEIPRSGVQLSEVQTDNASSITEENGLQEKSVSESTSKMTSSEVSMKTTGLCVQSVDSTSTWDSENLSNSLPQLPNNQKELEENTNGVVTSNSDQIDETTPVDAKSGKMDTISQGIPVSSSDDLYETAKPIQLGKKESVENQETGAKEDVASNQTQVTMSESTMMQNEDTVSFPAVVVKPKKVIWPFLVIVTVVLAAIVMFIVLKKRKKGRSIPMMDLIDDSPIEVPKRLISVSCPYEDEGDQSPLHVLTTLELSSCFLSENVSFAEVPVSDFSFREKLAPSKNDMETIFALSQFFRKMENETVDVYIKSKLNSRFHSIKWDFDVYSEEQDVPKIKLAFMLKSLSTGYELFYSSYQSIVGKIDDCDFSRLSFKGKRQ